jgi:DNA-binding IclR family transcriptional regulator
VEKTAAGLYAGGPELAALGRALGGGRSLEEFALEAMTEYTRATGESIAFARFFGERLVLVEKVEVADSFKLARRGQVFRPAENEGPAIVVAAHLAGGELARFTRSFESRVLDFAAFRREIVAYRRAGVRVEPMPKRPARGGPRRACVAVLDPEGRPAGELHTVVPGARFTRDRERIVERLLAARDRIERSLRPAK